MQVKVEGCMKLELYVEKHFCSYSNGKLFHSIKLSVTYLFEDTDFPIGGLQPRYFILITLD